MSFELVKREPKETTVAGSHVQDWENAMKMTRRVLRFLGAWPMPATSPLFLRIRWRIQNAIVYFLLLFSIVPGLLRMFVVERGIEHYLRICGPVINCLLQLVKYTILLCRADDIQRCMDLIKQDWTKCTDDDRGILRSKATLAQRVVFIHLCTMYCGGFGYRTIVTLSRGTIVTADNVTIRPMPCPAYFIFLNEQATPIYEIVFFMQTISGFIAYAVMSACCGICAFLVLHACSQLEILANGMKDLSERRNLDENAVQMRIVDLVDRRTKIKMYLDNTAAVTEYICLAEFLCGTFIVCCAVYYVLIELQKNNIRNTLICIVLLYAVMFSIFIYCYIGQLLDNENNNVGLVSATFNWYRLPKKKTRNFILIIAISNHPLKLTVGRVMDMSFTTFTDIMKVSMGYFNLLRRFL